jgi:hypothetical protein
MDRHTTREVLRVRCFGILIAANRGHRGPRGAGRGLRILHVRDAGSKRRSASARMALGRKPASAKAFSNAAGARLVVLPLAAGG